MKQKCLWGWMILLALLPLSAGYASEAEIVFGSWTYSLNSEGQAIITRYSGSDRDVNLAWNLQGHMVVEVGPAAFAENAAIETVKLPLGIAVIRRDAFRNCTNLKSVELPARLGTIEDGAFLGCEALTELELPESVAEIGEDCFERWTNLVGTENSLAGDYARAAGLRYAQPVQLTPTPRPAAADYQYTIQNGGAVITSYIGHDSEVIIPSELGGYPVRAIGESAFSSRYEVERVVVPEGVTELERIAFRYCPALAEIQLPSTLRIIGDNAFYRCERLEEVVIPEGVTELGEKAFRGCLQLRRVTLPASLKQIPFYAFFECHDRLTILAPKGSSAQYYAERKGYGFIAVE